MESIVESGPIAALAAALVVLAGVIKNLANGKKKESSGFSSLKEVIEDRVANATTRAQIKELHDEKQEQTRILAKINGNLIKLLERLPAK